MAEWLQATAAAIALSGHNLINQHPLDFKIASIGGLVRIRV